MTLIERARTLWKQRSRQSEYNELTFSHDAEMLAFAAEERFERNETRIERTEPRCDRLELRCERIEARLAAVEARHR